MSSPSSPLLDLPHELIYKICRNLSFGDLMHLLLSCRQIHGLLASDMCLWRALRYPLVLNRNEDQNVVLVNSMMRSPIFSYCTRLRLKYSGKNEGSELCIPTHFFSALLPALSHQLKELCLQHQFDNDDDDDDDEEEDDDEEDDDDEEEVEEEEGDDDDDEDSCSR